MKTTNAFLALGLLLSLCRNGDAFPNTDPYFEQALSELRTNPPPRPTEGQLNQLHKIVTDIKQAAQEKKEYKVDDQSAQSLGIAGFPTITPLLKDIEPRVRCAAARTIFQMDSQGSAPFLIGLLTDTGSYTWASWDVLGVTTVSGTAETCLRKIVLGEPEYRVPVDEIGQPQSHEKAMQRWFAYHLPYFTWQGRSQVRYGRSWFNGFNNLALISLGRPDEIPKIMEQPEKFKDILVFSPREISGYSLRENLVYKLGEPVRFSFGFSNLGTETIWVRYDQRNELVHVFRLVGPDGRQIPMKPGVRLALPNNVPELQPLWANAAMGPWEISLDEGFELRQRGRYRFYYSYVPPAGRDPKEKSTPAYLWFWDGRKWVNYFEFLLK